ncbi:MAG: putative sugar nucleotidyl transferase [Planctomycetota bacterium]
MRVCLFEDRVETLEPLALTRPAFDLRCGMLTLGEKLRRAFRADEWSAWVRPVLQDLAAQNHPGIPINEPDSGATLWLNARWLPPAGTYPLPDGPAAGMLDDELAWAVVPFGAHDFEGVERLWKTLPLQPAGGAMLRYPWDLVDRNAAEIVRDVAEARDLPTHRPASLNVVGPPERLFLDPSVQLDPLVVFDVTKGPVVVDAEAFISAFSRVEGPCVIGAGTRIMGAKITGGVTLGPQCRIGGEVECSIVQGYSNKYHEGFLGHSYLGEWVNVGAGTHTSDLRNDYGPIEIDIDGQRIATGRTKVGCYIGDHSKFGLGVLVNSGTNVGPFCNILPSSRFVTKHMPAFTNWSNGLLRPGSPIAHLFATATMVMPRRGQALTPAHIALYEYLWEATDAHRSRVLAEAEARARRGPR